LLYLSRPGVKEKGRRGRAHDSMSLSSGVGDKMAG
jgi:hypothetical protein